MQGSFPCSAESHYQAAVANRTPAAVNQPTSFLLQSCLFAYSTFQEKIPSVPFHANHTMHRHTLHAVTHTHPLTRWTDGHETTLSHTREANVGLGRGQIWLPEWTPRSPACLWSLAILKGNTNGNSAAQKYPK